ncbi:MAG TPA: stage II sporulation protein D [Firmicutes bacterium]|nr:stage II sporulation protein D [Bacillota bacterium]
MRPVLRLFIGVTIAILILPTIIVGSWERVASTPDKQQPEITVRLYVSSNKQLLNIGLEEYVKGVLAAEMPAKFHLEALRAQAVAARTYAVKRASVFGGKGCNSHPQADLCDDPAHCQAWLPAAELQKQWGMLEYQSNWSKICQAVESTAGEIITYQGVAIDPLFHSTCGGKTEDAGAVWQQSLPYLVSVECPYCKHSPKLKTEQRYSLTAFASAIQALDGSIAVTAQSLRATPPNFSIAKKTATGRADTVSIAGKTLQATTLRYTLGLNSTRFTHQVEGDQIVFAVQGYGHGVGLCQYGADGMGEAGFDYRAILQFYYRGTQVTNIR